MHRSKGMEFAKVILVGIGAKSLPRAYLIDGVADEDRSDVLQRERSLLYVAPPGRAMNSSSCIQASRVRCCREWGSYRFGAGKDRST